MSKRSGFDKLKEDFPIFTIENKTSIPRTLDIAGSEDILFPAGAVKDVLASDLIQMPNSLMFRVKNPTVKDLVKYGLIETVPATAPVKEETPEPVARINQ